MYKRNNEYTIGASAEADKTYLGCVVSARKPLAGETWTRGSDLGDGRISETTWLRILLDIISYETVDIKDDKSYEPDVVDTDVVDTVKK